MGKPSTKPIPMLQKNIFLLLLLGSVSAFSQEIVGSIPIQAKNNAVFQVVNEGTKQTVLFFGKKSSLTAVRLDENMKVLDSMASGRPGKDYDSMVGYNYSDSDVRLFWASSDFKDIYCQRYDFDQKKIDGEAHSIAFKEDRFLKCFSEKDRFYILSAIRKSNKLKLYIFGNNGKMQEQLLDLGNAKFVDHEYKTTNFYGLIGDDYYATEMPYTIQAITSKNPVSLTESSKKRKCYIDGKRLFLTFDTNTDFTQLLTIDLEQFTIKSKIIQQPYLPFLDRVELNSNSFLIGSELFQLKTSSQKMIFSIKDSSGNLIKEITKTPDDALDFKNSDIIQESGDIDNPRILEKTAQFLRKTNNQNSGIAVTQADENYLVTLGSVSDERASTGMVIGGMFGAAGVLVAYALSNPTLESFNSYSNRKVVYINCLFDKSGNHLGGALKPLAFDKLRRFTKGLTDFSSPTLFKLDNAYYFGYYRHPEKKYILTKFND
jgi:hypothetical protein